MTEMQTAMRLLAGTFPTGIQQVNYPIHKGQPNPKHGLFYLVGSIPVGCYDADAGHSKYYATEQEAIEAAIAAGATRIQGVDCRFIFPDPKAQIYYEKKGR